MVRPERFELPTLWFEAKCSIQLSYGRTVRNESFRKTILQGHSNRLFYRRPTRHSWLQIFHLRNHRYRIDNVQPGAPQ